MSSTSYQLVSIGINRLNPTDTTDTKIKYDNDHLFEILSDLVSEQFKPWYCKQFYRVGKDRVLVLASQARADAQTSPQRLFSHLLKKEPSHV